MKRIFATSLVAATALVSIASGQTAPTGLSDQAGANRGQAIEGVAVLVNDEVISYSDVRNRTRMILLSLTSQPDEETILQAQQRAIESLIEDKVKVQQFKELAKDRDIGEDEINARIDGLARQNRVTMEQFLANLSGRGVSPKTLRDQIRAEIAWNALVRGRFSQQVRVSELRVSEMMERVRESLNKPQFRVAEIFLYAPDLASRENAMARAETLRKQIEQGAPFELVAQQFSAAPSASAGGDLGWLTPADLRPEVQAVVEKATPPALLPPIQTDSGVYLVAALGKRDPADPSAVTFDLKQVTTTGDGVADKLLRIRKAADNCDKVAAAAKTEGAAVNDLNGIALGELGETIQAALKDLKVGEPTDVLDIEGDKSVIYVCSRQAGAAMPPREEIRDRLFDTEISMLADRYLRDLKREATIIRR